MQGKDVDTYFSTNQSASSLTMRGSHKLVLAEMVVDQGSGHQILYYCYCELLPDHASGSFGMFLYHHCFLAHYHFPASLVSNITVPKGHQE